MKLSGPWSSCLPATKLPTPHFSCWNKCEPSTLFRFPPRPFRSHSPHNQYGLFVWWRVHPNAMYIVRVIASTVGAIYRIVIALPSCPKFCSVWERTKWPSLGLFVGYYVTPVSCAGRVVYFTSHLCAIVLMAGYAGNYISFLSSGRPLVMPFTSLREMVEDGSYRLGAMSRSAQINFFDVRGFATTLIIYLPNIL